jgi:lysozyme family protein
MPHPFEELRDEYTRQLVAMAITRATAVDNTVKRLLANVKGGRYSEVSTATGIPQVFIAASFEREASSNFSLSPAQGDRWDRVSTHVPKGRGPFASWTAAALDAYHIDHLDAIGAANWSWERACYEGELFNGFGYRGHGIPSPYVWGGTNIQKRGKFTSDRVFDPTVMDSQLGIAPMMVRMAQIEPALMFASLPGAPAPAPAPLGGSVDDTKTLQANLNRLGANPQLKADGSFGRMTQTAVRDFQGAHGLDPNGLAGPDTLAAIKAALAR